MADDWSLPEGWKKATVPAGEDGAGRTYYFNVFLNKTQWEAPYEPAPPPPVQQHQVQVPKRPVAARVGARKKTKSAGTQFSIPAGATAQEILDCMLAKPIIFRNALVDFEGSGPWVPQGQHGTGFGARAKVASVMFGKWLA